MTRPAEVMPFPAPEPPASARVALADGAVAELGAGRAPQTLRLFAKEGQLLFEYDARTGKARATVERGDLELASDAGDVVLRAGRTLRLEGEAVALAGRSGVHLTAGAGAGTNRSVLSLGRDALELASARLGVTAGQAELRIAETRFLGERLRGWVGDARLTLGRLETMATTVLQKARDLYRSVEGLSELKAGRVRTLVRGTWHARSRNTVLFAEQDVSIDGEKIHLG